MAMSGHWFAGAREEEPHRGGRVDYRGVTSVPAVPVRPIWLGKDRALLAIDGRTRI